eukprot:SAG31_NODE_1763_length_7322_cov_21.697633_1_plen_80_part_00
MVSRPTGRSLSDVGTVHSGGQTLCHRIRRRVRARLSTPFQLILSQFQTTVTEAMRDEMPDLGPAMSRASDENCELGVQP